MRKSPVLTNLLLEKAKVQSELDDCQTHMRKIRSEEIDSYDREGYLSEIRHLIYLNAKRIEDIEAQIKELTDAASHAAPSETPERHEGMLNSDLLGEDSDIS